MEAIKKRAVEATTSALILARIATIEPLLDEQRESTLKHSAGETTRTPKISASRETIYLESKQRISDALSSATANLDSLAARYASEAKGKAGALREKIKSLLRVAQQMQKPAVRRVKRPIRRQTKLQDIQGAQYGTQAYVDKAAHYYEQRPFRCLTLELECLFC